MTEPNWLTTARAEIGQRQRSPGDNPRVLDYMNACGFYPQHDEGMGWCGCFATWVFENSDMGNEIPNDQRIASAYPPWWRGFGTALAAPQVGAIAIKKTGLHVAFVESVSGSTISLLGGNQDDAVKIWQGRPASDYTFRWPS